MILYNEKSLKDIQKERELEKSGNVKEQLAYVLEVQESNKDLTVDAVGDLSVALSQIMESTSKAIGELTMMIGAMGGNL
ncbi:hypothetical protein [Peptoniphilus senegalensis]|uniref:Methyl-accepting chemotaxis protein n=1 Tax=Peptoniphilus senegalensis TaxID=1465757 RepID=A0ABV1J1Y1_9FIRM|nr:hypothetical protein PEPTYR26121_01480 [Peptoniphilus tyrrelliae]